MGFDLDDAMYGLRNLSVMDEEETRIIDQYTREDFADFEEGYRNYITSQLPDKDEPPNYDYCEDVYAIAIKYVLKGIEPLIVLAKCFKWAYGFVEYEGDAEERLTEAAILAVDMWTTYCNLVHVEVIQKIVSTSILQ